MYNIKNIRWIIIWIKLTKYGKSKIKKGGTAVKVNIDKKVKTNIILKMFIFDYIIN